MIQFNELGISEDGNYLTIDVGIENEPEYESCYIDSVKVDLCSNTTTGNDVSDKAVVVYQSESYLIGDGNNDGVVDRQDYDLASQILDGILSNPDPMTIKRLDINNDGELSIADLNALSGIISSGDKTYRKYDGKKRVKLCLSKNDKVFDGFEIDDFSNSLFLVRVEAECDNAAELATLGCGWDNNVAFGVAYNGKPLYDAAVRYASTYGDTCSNNDASTFEDFILRYYSFLLALKCGDVKQACYYYSNYLLDNAVKGGASGNGCGCHGTY